MEPTKDDEGYYNHHCVTCKCDIRCKHKWRTLCSPCYKLEYHPDSYHRCRKCNIVCNVKYPFCYDCNKQVQIEYTFTHE